MPNEHTELHTCSVVNTDVRHCLQMAALQLIDQDYCAWKEMQLMLLMVFLPLQHTVGIETI